MGTDASDSARSHLDEFRTTKEEALEGFEAAVKQLKDEGKEV